MTIDIFQRCRIFYRVVLENGGLGEKEYSWPCMFKDLVSDIKKLVDKENRDEDGVWLYPAVISRVETYDNDEEWFA